MSLNSNSSMLGAGLRCLGLLVLMAGLPAVAATTLVQSNTAPITIRDNNTASLYPSNIDVLSDPGLITKVTVTLNNFSHTFSGDVDIVLVGPGGLRAVLMSDAGQGPLSNATITFDQTAATALPNGPITSGTFRPGNYGTGNDIFAGPGPGAVGAVSTGLHVFNGQSPFSLWSLYVVDDAADDVGTISGGWTLRVTTGQVFTVNSTADINDGACNAANCTLWEAVNAANASSTGFDQINFSALFDTPQTINLNGPLADLTKSVLINGPGADKLTLRRNTTNNIRIFTATGGIHADIRGLTLTNGSALGAGAAGFGGAVLALGADLSLTNVVVASNVAGAFGGGVMVQSGNATFTGCTFNGNQAGGGGGAIHYLSSEDRGLRIVNSTISGNSADGFAQGGGISMANGSPGGTALDLINSSIVNNSSNSGSGLLVSAGGAGATIVARVRNTLFDGNSLPALVASGSDGGTATITSLGFNLSSDNGGGFLAQPTDRTSTIAMLGALANNGGPTRTHALLAGSPAIDKGQSSGSDTDQRGGAFARPVDNAGIANATGGDGADIGAFEVAAGVIPATFTVTSVADSGAGTLRQAIVDANGNGAGMDSIVFAPLFNSAQTITLTSGQLDINSNLAISGPGANLLTISGNNSSRIFNIGAFNAVLSGMTLTNGNSGGGLGGALQMFGSAGSLMLSACAVTGSTSGMGGGGVYIEAAGFTINRCTLSGNSSTGGGGLNVAGASGSVVSSTISFNVGEFAGGGIFVSGPSNVLVSNSTIAANFSPDGSGAGLYVTGSAVVNLRSSLFSGNTTPNIRKEPTAPSAVIASLGFNLSSDDSSQLLNQATDKNTANPALGVLANNGGPTRTHALLAGSAAIDAGSSFGALTDQRGSGFPRAVEQPVANQTGGDGADIGAFEVQNDVVFRNGFEN